MRPRGGHRDNLIDFGYFFFIFFYFFFGLTRYRYVCPLPFFYYYFFIIFNLDFYVHRGTNAQVDPLRRLDLQPILAVCTERPLLQLDNSQIIPITPNKSMLHYTEAYNERRFLWF